MSPYATSNKMVTTAAEEAVVSIELVKDSFRLGVPSLFMVFGVLSY